MKKILLLGGSAQQLVAIETAKELGFYTVLCDYLTDNPGQFIADCFYLVSTTDIEAVLKVAADEQVDGVLAYASDPAAPTAAYVAEALNLPGNPFNSVEILCNKVLFRTFLKENGFFTPEAGGYDSVEKAIDDCQSGRYQFPIISKPVDSSGSKGVIQINSKEELDSKLWHSMLMSRSGKIIVEELVEGLGYQIAGDGLSIDGKLVFRCFGNDHFDKKCLNPFVPVAASFPYNMADWVQDKIHAEIQRLITILKMETCTYNFDIRLDKDYNVYLMEVAPRNGGNYIPQVIQYATGTNLVEYAIKAAVGDKMVEPEIKAPDGFWSYYAVHNRIREGKLEEIEISKDVLENHIVENHIIKHPGDGVSAFTGADSTLGCLIMKFDSMEQMLHLMDCSDDWIHVYVETSGA